jgi:hypothetical protein
MQLIRKMYNALCPTGCASGFALTAIKPAGCDLVEREDCIRAIGFYKCDISLPNPVTIANIGPLITAGTLVFSNPLADVVLGDPQTISRQLADCTPSVEVVVSREITFKDRIKVDVTAAGVASPFADYAFWQNKKQFAARLNYVIVMCSGNLYIPRDPGSNVGMGASFSITKNFEKVNERCYEFKAGKIKFLGDPLDFTVPAINLSTVVAANGQW